MASTEKLVQTWMASSREEEINQIVSDISNDNASLIDVVKALGEYLTSDDSDVLQKGVELLSLVVARAPSGKLNRQSVRVLITFFCGKLDDMVTIKPALSGLSTLVSLPLVTPAEVTTTLEALFRHVKMKTIVQDVRFKVFSIIDSLMAFHRDVLKSLGTQFLNGYISLAEGEKDPRNLMVAFAIARVILIEFDVSSHVESLFNILFCYFPITFRPPPNDKYGITTEDLRMSLRNCLNATPAFGPLAIPVYLEKLSAGSRATKKDTLQTLSACIPVYGSAMARVSARKLWNALKLEIFQPVDPETEQEALKATQVLVKTIYVDEEASLESNEDVQGLARDACEECIQILKEPEKSQAKPAIKILSSFMTTTPSVAKYVISQAVPHLVRLFLTPDEASTRASTLQLLSELITAARDSTSSSTSEEVIPSLLPYKDEVLGVFSVGLKLVTTRPAALSGLNVLASTKGLLSDEELRFIVHNVDEIIEGEPQELDDATDSILEVLTTIGDISPHHVSEQTLPLLSSSLPDSAPLRQDSSGREKCWRVLSMLSKLCVQPQLFEQLVIRLTTKLELLCFPSPEQLGVISSDLEPTAAYAHMILKALSTALSEKVKKKHLDVSKYIDRLVPSLFNVFVSSAVLSETQVVVATETRLIEAAAEIINLVVQCVPSQRQQSYSISLSKAIIDGDMSSVSQGFQKVAESRNISLFKETSTPVQRNLLELLAAAVISLSPEAKFPPGDPGHFLSVLLNWILDVADNDLQKNAALHIVSSVVNRQVDELSSFLDDKLEKYWHDEIANGSVALPRRIWAIRSWTWIAKALLVRKHPLAMIFTERLYDAFGDEAISWEAAKAIGNVASPDTVLTKANHAEIKILYVQKYVGVVLPKVIEFAQDSSDPTKQTAALVALTSLIKSIPRTTYAHQMPTLVPLLLRGLELPDAEIKSNIIETFLAAAQGETQGKSLVSEHSATLVNTMLKNCTATIMTTTRVRISALRYLAVLPSIVRYDVLHPQKPTVLRELAFVLDDPRRAVRKAAVDARTNWFKYKG